MDTTHSSVVTQLKVGIFSVLGLLLIIAISVVVNNRPYWWRPCQLVKINVEDATGLKTKSPIRSLGIEIGYLKSVALTETHVTLGICLTAPVEVLPTTRAYIRGEGFLGDKFVELKPVRYLDSASNEKDHDKSHVPGMVPVAVPGKVTEKSIELIEVGQIIWDKVWDGFFPSAYAEATAADTATEAVTKAAKEKKAQAAKGGREIPVGQEGQDVQHLVSRVDELVNQMTQLTDNLKGAINPEDLRNTMKQLNRTLENASKTLSPEGGLNQTAQRTLAKLEDSIEQLRDMLTRVNKGEGSIGMLVNDPSYADEIRKAIKNVNQLLTRVGEVRFVVDLGGAQLTVYNGSRGYFQLGIWPKPDRYYLLGIATDPRGRITNMTVTTTAGGQTQTTQTQFVDQTSLLLTGMLGKVFFKRLDLSVGALYGDGAGSVALYLGPSGMEDRIQLRNDIYARNAASSVDDRLILTVQPWSGFYARAGIESLRGHPVTGRIVYQVGVGVKFDDEDIKLLFAFK